MKITPIDPGVDLLASDLIRSPGLHMSELYGDFYKDFDPKRFGRGGAPSPMLMALGTAWEKHLEYLLIKAGVPAHRTDEFRSKEGIAFSPDLLIHEDVTRLGEIKLTWMSSKDVPRVKGGSFPSKFDKWFTQMKVYCHELETAHGRMYAAFVNGRGDKKGPPAPELLAWDVEFTAQEMRDEKQMLMNQAKHKGML